MLDESSTFGVNLRFGSPEKKFSISFGKAKAKVFLSFHYNAGNSYLFVYGKEIFEFRADNKNGNIPTHFCLESISNGVNAIEFREISLNANVFDFSVDYNFIDKSDILNILKNLMTMKNLR